MEQTGRREWTDRDPGAKLVLGWLDEQYPSIELIWLDGGYVPEVYAPWQTLYRWLRRWQRDGTWAKVLTRLQTVADEGDDGSAGEGVRRPARRVVGAATVTPADAQQLPRRAE